jgi:hypothetical protein
MTQSVREWHAALVQRWLPKPLVSAPRVCVVHVEAEDAHDEQVEDVGEWLDSLSDPESSVCSSSSGGSYDDRGSLFCEDLDGWELPELIPQPQRTLTVPFKPLVKAIPRSMVEHHPLVMDDSRPVLDFPTSSLRSPQIALVLPIVQEPINRPLLKRKTIALPAAEEIELDDVELHLPTEDIEPPPYTPPARFVSNSSHFLCLCLELNMMRNQKIVAPLRPRAGQWKSREELVFKRARSGSLLSREIVLV